jgi:ribosomal protein S18 acetylase RimI-like enzyme
VVSAAGYEVWGGFVAHIGVVTAASARGRGHGRAAVTCIANHAIAAGLVAQYQTLQDNVASIAIVRRLGFDPYATFTYAVARQSN